MRVELALVDEIHNLNLATQAGAEAVLRVGDRIRFEGRNQQPAARASAGRPGLPGG
ncbi:hypothetical protein ABZ353_09370 [Streptomyces niveus]|uniref:hypothetical protein n=1 Tax=Streptomyces niveus TaxID=193462 RepID=UPI0033E3DE51